MEELYAEYGKQNIDRVLEEFIEVDEFLAERIMDAWKEYEFFGVLGGWLIDDVPTRLLPKIYDFIKNNRIVKR
jgi:hypothetical protein